jgi:hypothetical protein
MAAESGDGVNRDIYISSYILIQAALKLGKLRSGLEKTP